MASLIEAFKALPLASGFSFSTALSPKWWLSYAVKAYEDDPFHVLIEAALFFIVIWLIFRKPYDPKDDDKLTEQEEDELIAEWTPDPLTPADPKLQSEEERLIVDSVCDAHVVVNGKECKNFSTISFLNFSNEKELKEACKKTVEKYGVGSCGPRGFYGSIDTHLNLEKEISQFYGVQEAIVYSDGIACVSSVIPAFSKRGDLIICDEGAHFGIQQGILLSRSNVLYFRHNDMNDLERVLQEVREKDFARGSHKLNRRFIIVEGISQYHGDICNLKKVVELKNKYKYRVLLDDSLAVGVLGATGRGSPEHWGIPVKEIEILTGTLDGALASVGGFCIGAHRVVDHQRLSGVGYCFSASAPPYTCVAGSTVLRLLVKNPKRVATLRANALRIRNALKAIPGITFGSSDEASPLIHVRLARPLESHTAERALLQQVAKKMRDAGLMVTVPEYIPAERRPQRPSIRICITAKHTQEDLDLCAKTLKDLFSKLLKK